MTVTLDVVLFNYLKHFIFNVDIDGKGGDNSTPYPETGGGTISGVQLKLGPKTVTWQIDGPVGTPGKGITYTARNHPELTDVPRDAVFLGLHIYPDETVELIPTVNYPRATEKGVAMAEGRKR